MIPYRMNPLGITLVETIPLTLTAEQAGSTVTLNATGSPTVSGLHYRLGKSGLWLPYTIGTTVTLANIGDSVQFWNNADTLGSNTTNFAQFVMTGSISASGDLMSMLNFGSICKTGCFCSLFSGCTSLLSAPEISAATIEGLAFSNGFRGCSNLTGAVIQATQLSTGCFAYMFYGASRLASVEVAFTEWLSGATASWMAAVSGSGTFTKPTALSDTRGTSNIPTGWTVVNK